MFQGVFYTYDVTFPKGNATKTFAVDNAELCFPLNGLHPEHTVPVVWLTDSLKLKDFPINATSLDFAVDDLFDQRESNGFNATFTDAGNTSLGNVTWCVAASSLKNFFPEDETTQVKLNLTIILNTINQKDAFNCTTDPETLDLIDFDTP